MCKLTHVFLSHSFENKINGWQVFVDGKGREVKDKEIFKHQRSFLEDIIWTILSPFYVEDHIAEAFIDQVSSS